MTDRQQQAQQVANDAAVLATFRELRKTNPFEAARHYNENSEVIVRAMNAELAAPGPEAA